MSFNKELFLENYQLDLVELSKHGISLENLNGIYEDYIKIKNIYENQAEFIASTLRTHNKIHSVKSRVKNEERLLEKIVRKTPNRKEKYGEDFCFTSDNYKSEITDLIGIRVIHIFKEDWEDIHNFITKTWHVVEITANIREGDDTLLFEKLNINIKSRKSGYRSIHYLIEFFPTNQRVVAEIQVRTIFEEGYGEIDHVLRYSHNEIPEILAQNLLLFNRITGCSDEMASFINMSNRSLANIEEKYENIINKNNKEISNLKTILEAASMDKNTKDEALKILQNLSLKSLK